MLLSRDLGDFARQICKSAQMCARAIYCGRATKFPVWPGRTISVQVRIFKLRIKLVVFSREILHNFIRYTFDSS